MGMVVMSKRELTLPRALNDIGPLSDPMSGPPAAFLGSRG